MSTDTQPKIDASWFDAVEFISALVELPRKDVEDVIDRARALISEGKTARVAIEIVEQELREKADAELASPEEGD